jgi:hypothetical protein
VFKFTFVSEYELTKPEWLGVLDLATEWKFEEAGRCLYLEMSF